MSTAVKVWCPTDESEPEGLSHLTTAPPNWFREEPAYAAELYALERWGISDPRLHAVRVFDDEGSTHTFNVTIQPSVYVKVTPQS